MPIISAHTAARHEGYFRLEWDLADQHTHRIARNHAFIVPVCVDANLEATADTPESFQRVQWTRLPGGETSDAFVKSIHCLLSGEAVAVSDRVCTTESAVPAARSVQPGTVRLRMGFMYAAAIGTATLLIFGLFLLERLTGAKPNIAGAASIAVLPFTNESGDSGQQYFSDGLSEDLITTLSQVPGLQVIGRTSSFRFRNSRDDTQTIGATLGVAHLLEGSV